MLPQSRKLKNSSHSWKLIVNFLKSIELYILIFLNFVVLSSFHWDNDKPFLCKPRLCSIYISVLTFSLCFIYKRAYIKIQVIIHTRRKLIPYSPAECHWESKIITFHWNYVPSEFSSALLEALMMTRECRWRQTNTTTMFAQSIVLAILCWEGNSGQITIYYCETSSCIV